MNSDQFLQFFSDYNRDLFPLQFVPGLLALYSLFHVLYKKSETGNKMIKFTLALFWIWTGSVFFLFYYNQEPIFSGIAGVLFILQGAQFFIDIFAKKIDFTSAKGIGNRKAAIPVLVYSMIIYYVIGSLFGRTFPGYPSFGLTPCPVTVFTLGVLLLSIKKSLFRFYIIPILWSIVSFSAIFQWRIWEDIGLLITADITIFLLLFYKIKKRTA